MTTQYVPEIGDRFRATEAASVEGVIPDIVITVKTVDRETGVAMCKIVHANSMDANTTADHDESESFEVLVDDLYVKTRWKPLLCLVHDGSAASGSDNWQVCGKCDASYRPPVDGRVAPHLHDTAEDVAPPA